MDTLLKLEKPKESVVDKSKLDKFYKEVLEYYKEENHSKENWKKYQEALVVANEVLNDKNATQKDVDKALKELANITKKMNKELEKPTTSPESPKTEDESSTKAPELPKTGDESGTTVLVLGLVISIVGIGVLIYNRKKKNIS